MITKYIGSASDFLKSNNIALVYSSNMLLESKISDYTPVYPFDEFHPIVKNSDGIFKLEVTEDFRFNNVIIYSDNLVPVGFTNLTQIIDTAVYKIETIQVNFDYTIKEDESYHIDIDFISYAQHISETTKVHKKLFSVPQRNVRTISRLELRRIPESDTQFTKNIYEMKRNPKLVSRYSGNLSKGFKKITSDRWSLPITEKSSLHDFINVSGVNYLISILDDKINFRTLTGELISMPATDISVVGKNLIISTTGDIYSTTDSLSSGELVKVGEVGTNLYIKDSLSKMIHFYSIKTEGISTSDKWLEDVLTNLNQTNLSRELKSVSEGVIVYENAGKTYFCTLYNNTPTEVVGTFSILKQLTNDLFIGRFNSIEDMGLFLIKLELSYRQDSGKAYEYVSATQIYLGKDGKYRKLDLLSKNVFPGVLKNELSELTFEGCCWTFESKDLTDTYLRRL